MIVWLIKVTLSMGVWGKRAIAKLTRDQCHLEVNVMQRKGRVSSTKTFFRRVRDPEAACLRTEGNPAGSEMEKLQYLSRSRWDALHTGREKMKSQLNHSCRWTACDPFPSYVWSSTTIRLFRPLSLRPTLRQPDGCFTHRSAPRLGWVGIKLVLGEVS